MWRRLALIAVIVCVGVVVSAAEVETVSRVFVLEHVSVLEASEAIQPLLSDHGSLTLHPSRSRMTVQDLPNVVVRVTELIIQMDQLPGSYKILVELLEGGPEEPFGGAHQVEADQRLKKMFKFAEYRQLGRTVLEGELGSPARADLGSNYEIAFVAQNPAYSENSPWGSPDPGNRVQVRSLVLSRVVVDPHGTRTKQELVRTNLLLAPQQKVYIGAGSSESATSGLVVIIQAQLVEGS